MSLLRENLANFVGASNESISNVSTTSVAQFVAAPESAEAGQIAFSMSAGEYGEIALEGNNLVGAGDFLYLTINGAHWKVALVPWTP